ncbi:hypothetical protein GOP47_0015266 [Adiantum capillus-veneris]|uniref:Protein RER1 n=1 Tax=Adiantum capillus-veneris TaxID=13818 RepID=A0A9D4ZD12_ADICA|nr:hypothetical protein GOP47_0015266 [Adiantum capillus-veneris]
MEVSHAEEGISADGGSSWSQWQLNLSTKYQQCLDKSTPYTLWRWLSVVAIALIYGIRVYYLEGFYIVTYGLGIYLLNQLLGFLSPQVDPESEGPTLPSKGTDEFKPFIRRLPEFKFWYVVLSCPLFVSHNIHILLFLLPEIIYTLDSWEVNKLCFHVSRASSRVA